jgi:hypothetical protein
MFSIYYGPQNDIMETFTQVKAQKLITLALEAVLVSISAAFEFDTGHTYLDNRLNICLSTKF